MLMVIEEMYEATTKTGMTTKHEDLYDGVEDLDVMKR